MRARNFVLNVAGSGLLQLLSLAVGLIIPRLIIQTYGSEVNGMVASATQATAALQYVEWGLGATMIFSLYRPLAEADRDAVSSIMAEGTRAYRRTSGVYLALLAFVALLYPLAASRDSLNYRTAATLVFIVGLYGFFEFFTVAGHRALLAADQRYFVVCAASIASLAINFGASLILISAAASILVVKAAPLVAFCARGAIVRGFVRRRYHSLLEGGRSAYQIDNGMRSHAVLYQASLGLSLYLPIVIVSFRSLSESSVFSVYQMIFGGVTAILSVFTTGSSAMFGSFVAKRELHLIRMGHDQYEFVIHFLISILAATTLILCESFVSLYSAGVADAQYVHWHYGLLFTIWFTLYNSRLPQTALINATGSYRETRSLNISQIAILLTLGLALSPYGIVGVLLAMISSAAVTTFGVTLFVGRNILLESTKLSFLRLLRDTAIVTIAYLSHAVAFPKAASTAPAWVASAVVALLWSTSIALALNAVLDRRVMHDVADSAITMLKIRGGG